MSESFLHIPDEIREAVWAHLLPRGKSPEQAAFVFVRPIQNETGMHFEYIEWYPVPPEGFEIQSQYHLELTDQTRAFVIKRAHDLDASLVEFHTHTGPWPAEFSPSDQYGFREFVPHVRWRLRGRPYFAVVVTNTGFDGLAWLDSAMNAQYLGAIVAGNEKLYPTRLSSLKHTNGYDTLSWPQMCRQ